MNALSRLLLIISENRGELESNYLYQGISLNCLRIIIEIKIVTRCYHRSLNNNNNFHSNESINYRWLSEIKMASIFRYRLSFERRLSKYLGVNHIAFPEEIIRKKLIKTVENFYPSKLHPFIFLPKYIYIYIYVLTIRRK